MSCGGSYFNLCLTLHVCLAASVLFLYFCQLTNQRQWDKRIDVTFTQDTPVVCSFSGAAAELYESVNWQENHHSQTPRYLQQLSSQLDLNWEDFTWRMSLRFLYFPVFPPCEILAPRHNLKETQWEREFICPIFVYEMGWLKEEEGEWDSSALSQGRWEQQQGLLLADGGHSFVSRWLSSPGCS